MREIYFSPRFLRALKKLDPALKNLVREREQIFRTDPFDSRLRTHHLKGELARYYSFSITYKYRILFEIEASGRIIFVNIGDHSIYE